MDLNNKMLILSADLVLLKLNANLQVPMGPHDWKMQILFPVLRLQTEQLCLHGEINFPSHHYHSQEAVGTQDFI